MMVLPCELRDEARLCPCTNTYQHLHGLDNGQTYHGTTLSNIRTTDLDFADNIAILSKSLEFLVAALDAFSNEAKPMA